MDILSYIIESQKKFTEEDLFIINNDDGLNDEEIPKPNENTIMIEELEKYIKNNNNSDVTKTETQKYITYTISKKSVFEKLKPFITKYIKEELKNAVKKYLKHIHVTINISDLNLISLSECRFKITDGDIVNSQGRLNYELATGENNLHDAVIKIHSISGILKFEKHKDSEPTLKTARFNFFLT